MQVPPPSTASTAPPHRRWRRRVGLAALALFLAVFGVFATQVAMRAHLAAPAPTPILYDRQGRFVAQIGHEERGLDGRRFVEYGYWTVDPLPDRVVRATLALEDRRFWDHPGVDPRAVIRALWQNLAGGRVRSGASTIAMQIARMQEPAPRTLWAKAVEAGTAIVLTQRYDRRTLLSHYLRLVPYGNGSHGIAHAARWYLDKPVADLSWAEIALLSAIPQAPGTMNPLRPDGLARAKARGQRALDELARQGVIGPEELSQASVQLAALALPPAPRRPDAVPAILRLRQMLARDGSAGLSPSDPRLRTALDLDVQDMVTAAARRELAALKPMGAQQVAVIVARRDTREVLAAVGSARYGGQDGGSIDFSRAIRSPGSTLKPFIYALAMQDSLLTPTDVMADMPEGASGISNADRSFLGPVLPRQALANSRNIPATNLLRRVGLDGGFRFFRTLGLHDLDIPAQNFGLSMAIGSLPTSLDRLVQSYGVLADDGTLRDLVWYRGQPLAPPRRVLSADIARLVTLFLSDPMARLPSFPRYGSTEFPFPVALKTGTSQGYRDAWVVAWSKDYMVGVWFGRPDAGTMRQVAGAGSAARLAHGVLITLHGARPGDLLDTAFPAPRGYRPVETCVPAPGAAPSVCRQRLVEWVKADAAAPAIVPAVERRPPDGPAIGTSGPPRLSVTMPENNARIWRNPEMPPALDRLALKASVGPGVSQIVWYVDDLPFRTARPDETVYWPMTPGAHRFQVRLPLEAGASRPVRIVVE